MRHSRGFAAAAALAVVLTAHAVADDQCPPLTFVASLDLAATKNGLPMVPVTVAGHPLYFIVATADPASAIRMDVAERLGLPRRHSNLKIVGLAGQVSDKLATAPQFAIGRLTAEDVPFIVTEAKGEAPPEGVVAPSGALGADLLRGYDVDLDFGANKMNLISRDHCADHVLYWNSERVAKLPFIVADDGKIRFHVTLDGHRLEAVLNTGIPMSTVKASMASELYDVTNDTPGNRREGTLANGTPLFSHVFQKLEIEGLEIGNPRLVIMPSLAEQKIHHMQVMNWGGGLPPQNGPVQPDFVLGMTELRQLHVYIDYHHQTIYFTPVTKGGDFPKVAGQQ